MNNHALRVLEFAQAMEVVAARAATPMGRDRVLQLTPIAEPESVRAELSRVCEVQYLLRSDSGWAPAVFPDARRPLGALEPEGGTLDPIHILAFLQLLVASRNLSEGLGQRVQEEGPLPHLDTLRRELPIRTGLEDELTAVVDDEGAVRDRASPTLRGIRNRLRALRGAVVRKLEAHILTLPKSHRVDGASVSVRDGRYVIPVRREGKSRVGGIIHGESATGATLFVEPPLAIRLMNEVHELERAEAKEVQTILWEATERLRPLREELAAGFEALVDFDSLRARAAAARDWDATVPEMLPPNSGELKITRGRHPLLLEGDGEVVPFSLELGERERIVVVSGPNTGGKTVFLKAVGLIHLLAQSGVVPPVGEGTRLPILRNVFADIGDEQSISQSLSTFSAHVENAREILEGAGPATLVLMDELGTGTDPSEGAALARVILEALVGSGARGLVTSHLGALKRLDSEGSGIVNASLLFDAERLAPTFQLQKGRPGRSFGLAIARRLGFRAELLDRAEAYVGSEEVKLEGLLEILERKERELSVALEGANAAGVKARERRAEAETDREDLEARERRLEAQARERARRLLLDARKEVEAAIEELNGSVAEELSTAAGRARRRIEEAAQTQRDLTPAPSPRSSAGFSDAYPVSAGDQVRVRESGARGVVRELRDDRVIVDVGEVRLQLPRSDVEPLLEERGQLWGDQNSHSLSWATAHLDVGHEVDLRGLRVDEVELRLGRALDSAIVENLSELRIIHGMGTGAVKARAHEILRSDGRVDAFRAGGQGQGGGGVTVAVLK